MRTSNTTKLLMPLLTVSATIATSAMMAGERPKQNLLFIIIDDLRPELGCYGEDIISPNINALAKGGVVFRNSYCNIPVSGASRACLLSGTRPTRNTFLNARSSLTYDKPDMIGVNEHFQNAGYETIVEGKVFHFAPDHQDHWDKRVSVVPEIGVYALEENQQIYEREGRGVAYECADVTDEAYFDGAAAQEGVKELERLAKSDKPFLFAYGVAKPHLPFIAPKKYWDMYDEDDITLPDNFKMGDDHNIPRYMFHNFGELRTYYGMGEIGESVDEATARRLIHGYKACVSYIDAQIGKILDKLEELGLDENTAVILLGDHGWNLGDHGMWCKHTLFDQATNAPIIIRDPASKLHGYVSDEIVEYVDMFPTMCDLVGIPSHAQVEGESVLPLLNKKKAKHKGYAISRWANGVKITRQDGLAYAEWWDESDNVIDRVLFDHNNDPEENRNVVDDPAYAKAAKELSAELMAKRGANYDKYKKKELSSDPFHIRK